MAVRLGLGSEVSPWMGDERQRRLDFGSWPFEGTEGLRSTGPAIISMWGLVNIGCFGGLHHGMDGVVEAQSFRHLLEEPLVCLSHLLPLGIPGFQLASSLFKGSSFRGSGAKVGGVRGLGEPPAVLARHDRGPGGVVSVGRSSVQVSDFMTGYLGRCGGRAGFMWL